MIEIQQLQMYWWW